jgi:hypothetical protein
MQQVAQKNKTVSEDDEPWDPDDVLKSGHGGMEQLRGSLSTHIIE